MNWKWVCWIRVSESLKRFLNLESTRFVASPQLKAKSIKLTLTVPSGSRNVLASVSTIPSQTLKSVSISSLGPKILIFSYPSPAIEERRHNSVVASMTWPRAIGSLPSLTVGTKTPNRSSDLGWILCFELGTKCITSPELLSCSVIISANWLLSLAIL